MLIKRFAVGEDIPALRTLWLTVFSGDTEETCAPFFEPELLQYCLVAETGGKPVSMVFSLPAELEGKRLQYIYAAATHPDHRGRGIFGELLEYALQHARDAGCVGSFLHPAEPSLVGYYARFGYRPWTYCERVTDGPGTYTPIARMSPRAYAVHRQRELPPYAIAWPSSLVELAAGSGAYSTTEAIGLCEAVGGTLLVREWLGEGTPMKLCGSLRCTHYVWVRPADAGEVYTLLCPFTDEPLPPPYIGPVFD